MSDQPKRVPPKKSFGFSISAELSLDVEEIWPDGDWPEDPTVDDVPKVIAQCGGKMRILHDWDLDSDLDLTVSDEKEARNVP